MVTTLNPNTALVLIDFQKAIMMYPLLTPASEILANAARLIAAFRKAGLPIVLVTFNPVAGISVRNDARQPSGTGLTADDLALVPDVKTEPGDIFITKHTWSAFHETNLDEELTKRNITGIVLAGVSTSRGVESTARAANERGYTITFAQDAMTDVVASAHENSIRTIFPRIGEVDNTDAIIALLEQ